MLGTWTQSAASARLEPEGENWWYGVEVPEDFARNIVPQGSITIDGISLTVARWHNRIAETAIIPYTYEHTNVRHKKIGDAVNLEGDVLGKYVERYLEARNSAKAASKLTVDDLVSQGFYNSRSGFLWLHAASPVPLAPNVALLSCQRLFRE